MAPGLSSDRALRARRSDQGRAVGRDDGDLHDEHVAHDGSGADRRRLVRQIRHVANVAGIDAVGIANDYTIAGELSAAKAGNDNGKIISNYYAWWDSVAKQGVMGFNTRPPHAVIPELNNVRRMYLLEAALARRRFTQGEVEKIMGGNWIRVLRASLG